MANPRPALNSTLEPDENAFDFLSSNAVFLLSLVKSARTTCVEMFFFVLASLMHYKTVWRCHKKKAEMGKLRCVRKKAILPCTCVRGVKSFPLYIQMEVANAQLCLLSTWVGTRSQSFNALRQV